ncbi:putative DNA-binding response regulator in two-component system [Georgfuchsia toluolica]|uniref:DNA-binding response regulator in two-component system n=1 Tax=Georgfuchsia toluolica TaxID=424218 RepID=A0A916J505_9PROT|nr:sigma 54-interacting transcriptional regulator [Georgfuchsia toluolica]CAG4884339.1 putative DNA-binding response regulator in two-component system [Georgfuchsia toluolica]
MNAKCNLLLVDDDKDLLKLLTMRLEAAGYTVTAVSSGEEALARIGIERPQLVITDMRMPGMDGSALFDAIRVSHPALPVMMLTAHGSIPDAVAATNRGIFGYLTKPYDVKTLIEQIERALNLSANRADGGKVDEWRREIVTQNAVMEDLLAQAMLVAANDVSVMLAGESGSGKEIVARAIHRASPRHGEAFIAVNCGAIPDNLLESELFGYVRGAFTGANKDYKGLVREANGGTLFLDEIGDMPLSLQIKLLRVLEEREVRPVGSTSTYPVDIRVISATHRNLETEMAEGRFRSDLFYRLNVVRLALPSLAERRDDIPLLANHFLKSVATRYRKEVNAFAPDAMDLLVRASWPGNVRQLLNVVEQAVALSTAPIIPSTLVQKAIRELEDIVPFDEARRRFEAAYLTQLLKMTGGNVAQAAKLAQRNRTDFYKLLQRHALEPGLFK